MPLVGKWKLVETSDGLPGCSCWLQVSPNMAHILEFTLNGEYRIKMPPISSFMACPGRYTFINDTTIQMTPDCGGPPQETATYSQSTKQLTTVFEYPASGRLIQKRYIKLGL